MRADRNIESFTALGCLIVAAVLTCGLLMLAVSGCAGIYTEIIREDCAPDGTVKRTEIKIPSTITATNLSATLDLEAGTLEYKAGFVTRDNTSVVKAAGDEKAAVIGGVGTAAGQVVKGALEGAKLP